MFYREYFDDVLFMFDYFTVIDDGDNNIRFITVLSTMDDDIGRLHPNQHYDESVDLNDSEEIASQYSPTPRVYNRAGFSKTKRNILNEEEDDDDDEDDDDESMTSVSGPKGLIAPKNGLKKTMANGDSENDDDDDDEEDDDDDDSSKVMDGAYNPSEFDNLPVSSEIRELFQYVSRYVPQSVDLEFRLDPFTPDYIPAVGDIDAFLKIPRVDGKLDTLGLTVLDEPCMKQSDPVVLDLMLRSLSKEANMTTKISVKQIEMSSDSSKHIDSWIKNIDDLHMSKPLPSVNYSKKMPEVDVLMQEWPVELEESIVEMSPPSELECDLTQLVDLSCAFLDIPIYKDRMQSLHVLFTLYSEFQNSQYFQNKEKMRTSTEY